MEGNQINVRQKSEKEEIKAIRIINDIVQTSNNPHRVLNVFNDFFINVGWNLSQAIDSTNVKQEGLTSNISFVNCFKTNI